MNNSQPGETTGCDNFPCDYACLRRGRCDHEVYSALEAQHHAETGRHPDDQAVDGFAASMKRKMAASRAKGRGGWQTCPVPVLWEMLREHVEKGDPRDVACIAMMIWANSQ